MSNLLLKLDASALKILNDIAQCAQPLKTKVYLVGGPVRDLILGAKGIDLDVVVEGNGIHMAEAYATSQKGSSLMTYPAFKTASVKLLDGRRVDFASCRKEVYVRPGAFPMVSLSTLKDDLFRRDFTINAIAIEIATGQIEDPFKGLADIDAKSIRILHNQSFRDDPTRILRAARFKEQFRFAIEEHTMALIYEAVVSNAMDTITMARYKKEMDKINAQECSAAIIKTLELWKVKPPVKA